MSKVAMRAMRIAGACLLLVGSASCDDVPNTVLFPIGSVLIAPQKVTIALGADTKLKATPYDKGGIEIRTPQTPAWSITPASVATISKDGVVHAVGLGKATVIAQINGVFDSAAIEVTGATSAGVPTPP